ncbi:BTB/POZ domain-containing protein 2-like [Culicoides brevitarsis]|uniref:BTB/POZ domain-containing protein 2-like n=1 Tax=Culicoides brevitarsis TaxID=469753 RepID=UPI00307C948B
MTEFKLKPIEGKIKATAKNQMIERLTEMYNNQKYFDVKFVFPTMKKDGNERFVYAHKLLMAVASPVFERMFFGGFKESSPTSAGSKTNDAMTTVEIQDIEPEVFQTVLRYVYTGDWEYHSIKELFQIFAVANKYEMIDLENASEQIIAENVNIENACQIHDFGITYDKEYMKANSMKYIQQYTSVVLKSPFFLTSLYETVLAILDQDHLNVEEEVEIFRGLQQYVFRNELTRDFYKEKKNGETGKDLLRKAVSRIRYLAMPMEDFANGPLISDLLTPDEKITLTHLMASRTPKLKLPQGFSDSKIDRGYISKIIEILKYRLEAMPDKEYYCCYKHTNVTITELIFTMNCNELGRDELLKALEVKQFKAEKMYDKPYCVDFLQTLLDSEDDFDAKVVLVDYMQAHGFIERFLT